MRLHPASSATTAAAALLALSTSVSAAKPRDAILLSQVESLTLRGDWPTSHRRVPAIPQLRCISSRALCEKHAVDLMRCENKGAGYDAEDTQWSCTAQLPPELKLGTIRTPRGSTASEGGGQTGSLTCFHDRVDRRHLRRLQRPRRPLRAERLLRRRVPTRADARR